MKKIPILIALVMLSACADMQVVEPLGSRSKYYCPVELPEEWQATKGHKGVFSLKSQFGEQVVVVKNPMKSAFAASQASKCRSTRSKVYRHDGSYTYRQSLKGCAEQTNNMFIIYYPEGYEETEHHELCHAYRYPMGGHDGWLTEQGV